MTLANPQYLWALTGLLIPLAIHLWSNKKGKIIKVGNTRFLEQSDAPQSSSIQLNEYLLLLLRMLIVAAIVLIMAEPHFLDSRKNVAITYLVEESLLQSGKLSQFFSRSSKDSEIRVLKKGLPIVDLDEVESNRSQSYQIPNYWSYIDELPNLKTDSLVIITKGYLQGLKGKRPQVPINAKWIVIDSENNKAKELAVLEKNNEYEILKSSTSQGNLQYQKEPISENQIQIENESNSVKLKSDSTEKKLPLLKQEPYHISIRTEDSLQNQAKYFEAAFKAISAYLERPIIISIEKLEESLDSTELDLLVWISETEIPANVDKVIHLKPDSYSDKLLKSENNTSVYQLAELLNPENIIDKYFVESLITILDFNAEIKETLVEDDNRVVAENELKPVFNQDLDKQRKLSKSSFIPWLLVFLFLLFIVERILSRNRVQ